MRILFCHENFPGSFARMAEYLGRDNEVLFASLHQRRGASIPNVRRILLRGDQQKNAASYAEIWQDAVNAGKARAAFWKKLSDDFQPDWLLYSFCGGIAFFLDEIFSHAFRVFYPSLRGERGARSKAMRDMQILPIIKSDLNFAFSETVKKAFPVGVNNRITLARSWLDCDYLAPGYEATNNDAATNAATNAANLVALDLRQCENAAHVEAKSFLEKASKRNLRVCVLLDAATDAGFESSGAEILHEPLLKERREIFRTADVYFNPEAAFSSFLEPMACGCPVVYRKDAGLRATMPFCKATDNAAWSDFLLAYANQDYGRLKMAGARAREWVKARYGDAVLVPEHIKKIRDAWLSFKEGKRQ